METEKSFFKSRIGLIFSVSLAYAGLGNIWRFPYLVGKYGGAAFLIPYFIFIIIVGWLGMNLEWIMGKFYRSGTIGSFYLRDHRFAGFGTYMCIISSSIVIYYALLAGDTLTYMFYSFTGIFKGDTVLLWKNVSGPYNTMSWVCWLITLLLSYYIVTKGVKIFDKLGKIMGPLLLFLMFILFIRSVTLPGAFEGIKFYVKPNFAVLKQPIVWIMALTQVFWSIGPGWGNALTLAARAKEKEDIPFSSLTSALGDTTYAILAGWVIFPALFANGLSPKLGMGLAFITIPKVFLNMPLGPIFSALFFLCIWFLAITSVYTFGFETFVFNIESFGVKREKANLLYLTVCIIGGIFFKFGGLTLLGAVDTILGCYGLIFSVLGLILVTAWAKNIEELRVKSLNKYAEIYIGSWWNNYIKYGLPTIIIIITGWFLYDSRGLSGIDFWSYGIGGLLIALSVLIITIFIFRERGRTNE